MPGKGRLVCVRPRPDGLHPPAEPDVTTSEYTVRLDAFEGPLDLLLFLIRRAEVEVTDIPIARITEQYLRHIEHLADESADAGAGGIDIERAGEFLVMAATLMEIKSRMLTPVQPGPARGAADAQGGPRTDAEAADPRAELVRQLIEYKRFRDASDALDRAKREHEARFPAGRALSPRPEKPAPDDEPQGPVDIDDLQLIDLVQAFARILETVDLGRVGEHRVVMDDTPVELHAQDIVDRLERLRAGGAGDAGGGGAGGGGGGAEIEFVRIFEGRTRSEMIGLFLAVLELVKQQRVLVRQEDADRAGARIVLKLADGPPEQPSAAPAEPA
jgi:segregation and condensation protein A